MVGQNSRIVLCLLDLLQSGRAGLDIDAAAADVIAADARFNLWILQDVKTRDVSEESWMQLLERLEEATDECTTSVQKFAVSGDRSELHRTLQRIANVLNERPVLESAAS